MFTIDWDQLTKEDEEGARVWLNTQVKAMKMPTFVGSVEVLELGFGSTPPSISIIEVDDVPPALAAAMCGDDAAFDDDQHTNSAPTAHTLRNDRFIHMKSAPAHLGSPSPKSAPAVTATASGTQGGHGQREDPISGAASPLPPPVASASDGLLSSSAALPSPPPVPTDDPANDVLARVYVRYEGDAHVKVSAEFIALGGVVVFPVVVELHSFCISGIADVISLEDNVHICFEDNDEYGPVIRDVKVRTEMGVSTKRAPKGIDKVGVAIVSQLRSALKRFVMFPNKVSIPKQTQRQQ